MLVMFNNYLYVNLPSDRSNRLTTKEVRIRIKKTKQTPNSA